MKLFNEKYGHWVVIIGASSGIDKEYAQQLALQNLNLVLMARRQERLDALAKELISTYEIKTKGVEDSGRFIKTPIAKPVETLSLNCKAPLMLSHHFTKKMVKQKSGGIIFMSSLVVFQGTSYIENYAATKAYDLILSENLAVKLHPYHIDILSANSSFSKTKLSQDFNFKELPISPIPAQIVATSGLKFLWKKCLVIPCSINKFLYYAGKFLQPRRLNPFSFGKAFSHVLRNKLQST